MVLALINKVKSEASYNKGKDSHNELWDVPHHIHVRCKKIVSMEGAV